MVQCLVMMELLLMGFLDLGSELECVEQDTSDSSDLSWDFLSNEMSK